MQKIISKPTATFKSWLATYLTYDQMDDFLGKHTKVYSIEQIKTEIIAMTCDNEHIRNDVKLSSKKNKPWLDIVNKNVFLINHYRNLLGQALIDDLIVNDGHHKPHVLNHDDLFTLHDTLSKYLHNHLSVPYKIKWILQHKTISDKTLGRKIMLKPEEINSFKSNSDKISQMKLESATVCAKYYDKVVEKQLSKI